MAYRKRRFTIYDAMEEKGMFAKNPANPDSVTEQGEVLYRGPVQYPKMLYSPTGEQVVTVPAEVVVTPLGPKLVGEQKELIHLIVNSDAEELTALSAGWHLTPGESMKAGGLEAPPETPLQMIARLQAEKRELEQKLAASDAAKPGLKAPKAGTIADRLQATA